MAQMGDDLMTDSPLDKIMDRWRDDAAFRSQMRSDPESAVRSIGVELSDDEWATLRGMDWSGEENDNGGRLGILNPLLTTTE